MPTMLDRVTTKLFYEVLPSIRAPLLKSRLVNIKTQWHVADDLWEFENAEDMDAFLIETVTLLEKYHKSKHFRNLYIGNSTIFISSSFYSLEDLTNWLKAMCENGEVPDVDAGNAYRKSINHSGPAINVIARDYFKKKHNIDDELLTLFSCVRFIVDFRTNAAKYSADYSILSRNINPLFLDLFAILNVLEVTLYGQRD